MLKTGTVVHSSMDWCVSNTGSLGRVYIRSLSVQAGNGADFSLEDARAIRDAISEAIEELEAING